MSFIASASCNQSATYSVGFDGVIVLSARDGYLGIVDLSKAREKEAFMTFAQAYGMPFRIDNGLQDEPSQPLGPFYLVWDNRSDLEL